MEDSNIVNRICLLLKKKLGLFKRYLSLTEEIKEAIGGNIDKRKMHIFFYKRRGCINSIDTIDGSIMKLIKSRNCDKNYYTPKRFKGVIDPYIKGIKNVLERICDLDSELLIMAREETEHFQTKLLKMRKFRQGVHGYRKGKKIPPRFLNTVK